MTADRVTVAELQELLAADRPVTVLDVLSPSDVDWEIPGAIRVDAYGDLQSGWVGPLADLNLPSGPVVTVCGVGWNCHLRRGRNHNFGHRLSTAALGRQAGRRQPRVRSIPGRSL